MTQAEPRLLIVENEIDARSDMIEALRSIPGDDRSDDWFESNAFVYHEAGDAEAAKERLDAAQSSHEPYALVLLDLGLPAHSRGIDKRLPEEIQETGFTVLEHAVKTKSALGVVIVSQYGVFENVVKLLVGGASDFIRKPQPDKVPKQVLQKQVLSYFQRESMRILDQRVKDLILYGQSVLAYQLGVCFSSFVQDVLVETEALEKGFSQRWGLDIDRDSDDPNVRRLMSLKAAVTNARQTWQGTQSSLVGDKSTTKVYPYPLEDILKEIDARLVPCFMLKRARILGEYDGRTAVLSFEDDVSSVLREIILGPLSRIPDRDPGASLEKTIEVFIKTVGDQAEVTLRDSFVAIEHEDAELINGGKNPKPDPKFGRVWGLSLVQQIAMRGGGRIEVNPRPKRGNVITYRIPRALYG
jgi:CheY-like chemotaxis protein